MLSVSASAQPRPGIVLPFLTDDLICYYDFDHPVEGDAGSETDLGLSGTTLHLVNGGGEPDVTSGSDPAGIKIDGSFPQNTAEKNAFNGRFDDLMFFDRSLAPGEFKAQFERFGY